MPTIIDIRQRTEGHYAEVSERGGRFSVEHLITTNETDWPEPLAVVDLTGDGAIMELMEVPIIYEPGVALCVTRRLEPVAPGSYHLRLEYEIPKGVPFGKCEYQADPKQKEWYDLRDLNGNLKCNTVGDLLKNCPPRTYANQVYKIKAYFQSGSDFAKLLGVAGRQGDMGANIVNNTPWCGCPEWSVLYRGGSVRRLCRISEPPEWAYDTEEYWYYEVTFDFEVSDIPWLPNKIVNNGTRGWETLAKKEASKDAAGHYRPGQFRDKNNVIHGGGVLIDKDGIRIDMMQPEKIPNPLPTVEFYDYFYQDFNGMFPFIKSLIGDPEPSEPDPAPADGGADALPE